MLERDDVDPSGISVPSHNDIICSQFCYRIYDKEKGKVKFTSNFIDYIRDVYKLYTDKNRYIIEFRLDGPNAHTLIVCGNPGCRHIFDVHSRDPPPNCRSTGGSCDFITIYSWVQLDDEGKNRLGLINWGYVY